VCERFFNVQEIINTFHVLCIELKKWCKKVCGRQAVIMEVSDMAGKLLKNISPDKTGNQDVEYYLTGGGVKSGVCD